MYNLNESGELTITHLNENTTLQDMLDELDNFLDKNPLPCATCKNNCCKQPHDIRMDNFYFLRKTSGKPYNIDRFIKNELFIDFDDPHFMTFYFKQYGKHCRHISGLNRCLIYNDRPLDCRFYTCRDESIMYKLVTGLIQNASRYSFAFNIGDVYAKKHNKEYNGEILELYKNNPFYEIVDFSNIKIKDIIQYVLDLGMSIEDYEIECVHQLKEWLNIE